MNNRRQFFQDARSFIVYYGNGQLDKLANYDIAIIEPTAYSAIEVQALKATGTLVLGYVTVMELGSFHDMYSHLKDQDFLRINGEKYYKQKFQTYLLDLKSKHWQGLLQHHIGKLLMHEGYDGVFLDTIGDVEDPAIPPVESELQIMEAEKMVRHYRSIFPQHVFVQNNGLERLCQYTAKYLDGVCWENPLFTDKHSEDWCQSIMNRILSYKEQFGLRALFLHESLEIKDKPSVGLVAQSIADKNDFLYYKAPSYLSL